MRSVIVAAAAIALSACSTYDSVTQDIARAITPYRITVVQGNFVSAEQAAQLQAGMTRDQVRALLGTPLLTDIFHADRWDYIFYFKRGFKDVVQERDLVLNFSGDTLASWTGGDNLPSEQDLLSDIDGDKHHKKAAATTAASAVAAASAPSAALPAASAAPAAAGSQFQLQAPASSTGASTASGSLSTGAQGAPGLKAPLTAPAN
jgi:outer membrane protein assembly factor BamE